MDHNPPGVPAQPDRDASHKPRRATRLAVDGKTSLRAENRYRVEVRIRNVSAFGFMADCPVPILIGSYVMLDVPGIGPVHAQVRWQIGTRMGGMFLDPIGLDRCEWTATKAEPQEERG